MFSDEQVKLPSDTFKMPLTVREGALLGAGVLLATGATVFYRQKATTPFRVSCHGTQWTDSTLDAFDLTRPDCVQIAYFLAWPVLGSAIILTSTPSDERLIKVSLLCGWQPFVIRRITSFSLC